MNNNEEIKNENTTLAQLVDRQSSMEPKFSKELEKDGFDKTEECVPPPICQEFQTARLFLSHFGFLNMDTEEVENSPNGGLTALDPTIPGFCADLESLDQTSPRTCDTVHVFYVKTGQRTVQDILANSVSSLN